MAETNQATTDNAANSLPPLFLPKQIKKRKIGGGIKLIAPSRSSPTPKKISGGFAPLTPQNMAKVEKNLPVIS